MGKVLLMTRPWLTWCLVAQGVLAQPPVVDQELRALNDTGKKAFAEKRYLEALVAFQEAHARSGLPEYLFNMATVQRLLGDCAAAAKSYRRFLAAVPTAPNRSVVEARLADVEKCAGPPVVPQVPSVDVLPAEPVTVTAIAPSRKPAWPWVIAGAGVAALGVGLGLFASAHVHYASLATSCAPGCGVDTWRGYDVRERAGVGLLVGGVLTAAAGVLLGLLLPAEGSTDRVVVRF